MYTPDEAAKILREEYGLISGKRVYTVVRHVSASGLTTWISVFVVDTASATREYTFGEPAMYNITHLVGTVLRRRVEDKHGSVAIRCGGTGLNHSNALVYDLGQALWAYTGQSGDAFECREI